MPLPTPPASGGSGLPASTPATKPSATPEKAAAAKPVKPASKGTETAAAAPPSKTGSAEAVASPTGETGDAALPGEAFTPDEHRDNLDRKLGSSLSEFDALLLREQQILSERQAAEAAGGGEASGSGEGRGGAAAKGGGRSGQREARSEPRKGTEGRERGESKRPPAGPQAPVDEKGAAGGAKEASVGGAEQSTDARSVPPDVGDGRDDDVVARQLREAATQEDDPAMREKLWQEYRDYKKSVEGT